VIHPGQDDHDRHDTPPLTYFHGATNEDVSQYSSFSYATCRTSHKDNADDLRDSFNESTLQFVASLSDDELIDATNIYFVIPNPPAVFNPYYLSALH